MLPLICSTCLDRLFCCAPQSLVANRIRVAEWNASITGPMPTFRYPREVSIFGEEVCGISHLSQYSASFATDVSDPVKATYPSGRTKAIEGEVPKYFSNLSWLGWPAISCPPII